MASSQNYPRARKRFGQNFLQDQSIIESIIAAISPAEGQHMVEIGPGRAALTEPLLANSSYLDVIELDRDLVPLLQQKLGGSEKLHIHQADALKFDYRSLVKNDEKLRVVGNLPYNITTPLLFHLIDQADVIDDMCFMLQKEVVERICAQPGTKQYGRLSVMTQYHCFVEQLFIVPPEAFDPAPKVDSAIIYLQPKPMEQRQQVDVEQLNSVVTQAFSQRRKTISNTLKNIATEADFLATKIDPKQRPETISLEQYITLTQQLTKH